MKNKNLHTFGRIILVQIFHPFSFFLEFLQEHNN